MCRSRGRARSARPAEIRVAHRAVLAGEDEGDRSIAPELIVRALRHESTINPPAEHADDDLDGIAAFLEYATGGSPEENTTSLLPSIARSGNSLILTVHRNLAADDVLHSVEASAELPGWGPANPSPPARTVANGIETLTYIFPIVPGAAEFFRVRFLAP